MILGFLKERQRKRLRARPFPNEWLKIIKNNVAFFVRLSATDQGELLDYIQVFLAEKRFEGCAGLEITDEICVTIAARCPTKPKSIAPDAALSRIFDRILFKITLQLRVEFWMTTAQRGWSLKKSFY